MYASVYPWGCSLTSGSPYQTLVQQSCWYNDAGLSPVNPGGSLAKHVLASTALNVTMQMISVRFIVVGGQKIAKSANFGDFAHDVPQQDSLTRYR